MNYGKSRTHGHFWTCPSLHCSFCQIHCIQSKYTHTCVNMQRRHELLIKQKEMHYKFIVWEKFGRHPNNTLLGQKWCWILSCTQQIVRTVGSYIHYACEFYVNHAYYLQCSFNQQNYASWFTPISIFRNWANDVIFLRQPWSKLCPKIVRTWFGTARYSNPNSIWL